VWERLRLRVEVCPQSSADGCFHDHGAKKQSTKQSIKTIHKNNPVDLVSIGCHSVTLAGIMDQSKAWFHVLPFLRCGVTQSNLAMILLSGPHYLVCHNVIRMRAIPKPRNGRHVRLHQAKYPARKFCYRRSDNKTK
jgi:hypothetical protein